MSHSPDKAPFIVTAELPRDIFSWANGLRTAHFPVERNHLKAHVTLFHSFAPSLRAELPRELARLAGEYAPPPCRTNGLMDLGGGTAIALHSPEMLRIRNEIAERFYAMLTAQDRGGKKLHITVQNKVDRPAAKALQVELADHIGTREFHFIGLGLHLYLGPHWEEVGVWKFRGHNHA